MGQNSCSDQIDVATKSSIRANLKIVMSSMDLDTATSKQIQDSLKRAMPGVPLEQYKKYIDNEVGFAIAKYLFSQ